ncbi:Heterokaryon incompatibility protein 6- OR allele [Apiospora saccharicola]
MATGTIKYRKLHRGKNEIRLLELLPAHDAMAPVVCRLVTVPLTEDLEYLALSSLYGDHNDASRIVVDDRQVLITTHLAQALKHVRTVFFPSLIRRQQEQAAIIAAQEKQQRQKRSRQPSGATSRAPRWLVTLLKGVNSILPNSPEEEANTPLRVWVDVLCINQADDDEKERQRSGIAQIYGSAKMVIGWVGLKIPQTDAGLAAMHEIHNAMPRHWGDPEDEERHPEDYSPQHQWARSVAHLWAELDDGTPAFKLDHWIGAVDFLHRPYMQRRWILEEIALAQYPTFLIGDAIVSWKLILRMNRFMEELKEKPSNIFPAHLRTSLADMPLGTVHALLDEFAKRRRSENQESLNTTQTSERTKYSGSVASKHDSKQEPPQHHH